jgi:hypothetical protein
LEYAKATLESETSADGLIEQLNSEGTPVSSAGTSVDGSLLTRQRNPVVTFGEMVTFALIVML